MVMTTHIVKQIDKLKKDFDAVKDQNDRLIGQLHGHGAVQSRVQKRQWSQASYLETSSSSSPPHKQARVSLSGCSLDQIRDVLGGPDRGWGLVQYVSILYGLHFLASGESDKGSVIGASLVHTAPCLI